MASAQSLADLLPLAVEVVAVAFRVGLQVDEIGGQLHPTPGKSESWSVAFSGINEASAKDALNASNTETVSDHYVPFTLGDIHPSRILLISQMKVVCKLSFVRYQGVSKANQAYISAVGPGAVTISGSPMILRRLLDTSTALKGAVGLPLSVHAPYHAPDLYGEVDTHAIILGTRLSTLDTINRYRPTRKIYSSTTGKYAVGETTLQLLYLVVHEILRETLRWDILLANCVADFNSSGHLNATVSAFGPTSAAKSLVSALKKETNCQIHSESSSAWPSTDSSIDDNNSGDFQRSKIAIVGMAGRFPNASNHEKLWSLLENGLDVHREVRCLFIKGHLRHKQLILPNRFQRIVSIPYPMSIRMVKNGIPVTRLMDAS